MPEGRFMTQADGRKELGIGETTWHEWKRRKMLPPMLKIGNRVLIERTEWERWLANLRETAAA